MSTVKLIEYEDASPDVRAVYDDLREVRETDFINNFWKACANHPEILAHLWEDLKRVMAPGELDAVTKQMIYVGVSIANGCEYCIHSHTAAAFDQGMTDAQYQELLAVVAMAHRTNGLATGMHVPVDEEYQK